MYMLPLMSNRLTLSVNCSIRSAVEGIYKIGKFDPDIMQKAEKVTMPLVTFANRLPKAPIKAKKDVEEKKAPASSSSTSGASRPTKGPKELYDRIDRLEERVSELEVWTSCCHIIDPGDCSCAAAARYQQTFAEAPQSIRGLFGAGLFGQPPSPPTRPIPPPHPAPLRRWELSLITDATLRARWAHVIPIPHGCDTDITWIKPAYYMDGAQASRPGQMCLVAPLAGWPGELICWGRSMGCDKPSRR